MHSLATILSLCSPIDSISHLASLIMSHPLYSIHNSHFHVEHQDDENRASNSMPHSLERHYNPASPESHKWIAKSIDNRSISAIRHANTRDTPFSAISILPNFNRTTFFHYKPDQTFLLDLPSIPIYLSRMKRVGEFKLDTTLRLSIKFI